MKNKAGMISGFIVGATGFLLMFKLIFLDRISPADEVAPGMVVIAAVLTGLVLAFAGSRIQQYYSKKKNYKM